MAGRISAAGAAILFVLVAAPARGQPSPSADEGGGFTVTRFAADYTLDPSVPGGGLHVIEHFDVDFDHPGVRLDRALPTRHDGRDVHLNVNDFQMDGEKPVRTSVTTPWGTSTSTDESFSYDIAERDDEEEILFRDPDDDATGTKPFTLDYTERNVITFHRDHDEFRWTVTGPGWQQPSTPVSVHVHGPAGLKIQRAECFTGGEDPHGGPASHCAVVRGTDGVTIRTLAPDAVSPGSARTLTVVLSFPEGTFTPPPFNAHPVVSSIHTTGRESAPSPWYLLALVLPLAAIGAWFYRHRNELWNDAPPSPSVLPRHEPPEDLSVAEADVILHLRPRDEAIWASVVDLAIRGWVRVHAQPTPSFELARANFSGLEPHEAALLDGMFEVRVGGTRVTLADLEAKHFRDTARTILGSIPKMLAARGYFQSGPPGLSIPKRSAKGAEALAQLKGLELHMKLEDWHPDGLVWKHDPARLRTEVFERLWPFAMLFGLEARLVELFESVYGARPPWFIDGLK